MRLWYLSDIDPRTAGRGGLRKAREEPIVEILKRDPDATLRYKDMRTGYMITEKPIKTRRIS